LEDTARPCDGHSEQRGPVRAEAEIAYERAASCVLARSYHRAERMAILGTRGAPATYFPKGVLSSTRSLTTAHWPCGLEPGRYVLNVSRLEPENNDHVAIEAHTAVKTDLPLALVGERALGGRRRAHERARAGRASGTQSPTRKRPR
jgi:hypothetical protein